ncbi:MAG: hypothetical protein C4582_06270 [Desulfobacteraceae bacterium]|nr:MAG: hypothetical protein C4582_06270 [Desulfobacteraceae bacterium]
MPRPGKKKGISKRLTGIIVPVEWDGKGRPVRIAISTTGEEEYIINPDSKGDELYSLMRRHVELSGFVSQTEDKKMVTVDEYWLRDR